MTVPAGRLAALALVLALSFTPPVPAEDAPVAHRLYLHSNGAANAETVLAFGTGSLPPWMDETAPTQAAPKLAQPLPVANTEASENFLLAYWVGNVEGELRSAKAVLYVTASTGGSAFDVTADLFDSVSSTNGDRIARQRLTVPAGALVPVEFDFGALAAPIHGRLVLQVWGDLVDVAIAHDAATTPSHLDIAVAPLPPEPGRSWTPTAGWGPVVRVSGTDSHREVSLAISPVDEDLMAICAPSGVPNTAHGQSYFHVSRDGGDTWDFMPVETGSTDPRRFAFEGGDCDVAFDEGGTMYSADTWLGSLSVGASRDGGRTWTGTPLAATAPVVDRPWLVGGPDGVMHVTWQDVQNSMPSLVWYARTEDHGLTWSAPVSVTHAVASGIGPWTWEGNLAVSADQMDMYLVYTRRTMVSPAETVWVAASHDGGATWTQHLVSNRTASASYLYPSIDIDDAGGLHVVFSQQHGTRDRPVWYTRSTDEGLSWTTPFKVKADLATYAPWVAAGAEGEAFVHWYGSTNRSASTSGPSDWWLWWATVKDGAVTGAGTTTVEPIFSGTTSMPEFNQVRLTSDGKMHIGAAAFTEETEWWTLYYQRQL